MGKQLVNFYHLRLRVSYYRPFGPMTLWTNEPSDQWPFGPMTLRTNEPSDQLPGTCHIIDKMTQALISYNSKNISCYFNSRIDTVKITPLNRQLLPWHFQNQYSYLHSDVIMCITLLMRWRKRYWARILLIFQPWNWYHENYNIVQSETRNIKQLH